MTKTESGTLHLNSSSSLSTQTPCRTFRTQYGPHLKVALTFTTPGRTKQEFTDECDINRIMSQYLKTGVAPVDPFTKEPQYVDCTGWEYQAAMETIAHAHSLFQQLPSHVRDRFENDPQKFVEFAENPDNGEEMVKMGLAKVIAPSGRNQATPVATPPSGEGPTPPKSPAKGMSKSDERGAKEEN